MNVKLAPAIAVAALLGASAIPASGQTDQGAVVALSLDDAVQRGLAASYRLGEAQARSDASAAAVDARHAAALPRIAGLAGYTRTNHVEEFGVLMPNNQLRIIYPDVPGNYRARLDAEWPLYTGGRAESLERAAARDAAASAVDVETARADLRLEITRAYWSLVTAIESARVVDESLGRVDAELRDVRNQLDVGLIAPNEVLSVEAQQSRQRMLSIQAHAARDVAEAELARLAGLPPATRVEPISPLQPPTAPEEGLDRLIEEARANRPERVSLVERASAARERARAAAAGSRPTVAVVGGLDYARPNPRIFPRRAEWTESWDAGVAVSWPLFDGGRTRAETAEASAIVAAADARLADFDRILAVELQQRISELVASRAAVAAADDAIRAAREARRVAGERFNAGVATSTDVLRAEVALLQAGLDRTEALAGSRLARARLARAMGDR